MGSTISKGGGNASLASVSIEEGRVSTARWNPKGLRRSSGPESMGAIPTMNRSAKEGARSSRHYGDEGAIHPPLEPRCVRPARSGRTRRDPRKISSDARRARSAGRRRAYKPTRRRGGRCPVRSRRTAKYLKRGQDNPRDPAGGGGVLRGRPSAKALGAKWEASE